MEGVARIAAMRRGIGEQRYELQEPQERIRIAVGEHDGQRRVASAAFVDEMQRRSPTVARKWAKRLICASCARQSYRARQ